MNQLIKLIKQVSFSLAHTYLNTGSKYGIHYERKSNYFMSRPSYIRPLGIRPHLENLAIKCAF